MAALVTSDSTSAAEWAEEMVAEVRDDPEGRMALMAALLLGPVRRRAAAPPLSPCRAVVHALAAGARGVATRIGGAPGEPVVARAVNERILARRL